MRPNPVRHALLEGRHAFGTMAFEFFTPGLLPVLADAGAEFVILDMEHSGVSLDTIKAQIAFARGTGVVPMVRVPALERHLVCTVLDAGAMGIMSPMLANADEARRLARWCRYRPEGERGLAFGLAHDDYAGGDINDKMRAANERTLTIALIETVEGIDNVEAIAAVDGIDVLWLGHFDLTNAMGISGEFENERFLAAVKRLADACRAHRKTAGILVGDVRTGATWIARGFRALCFGTDVAALGGAMRAGIAGLKASAVPGTAGEARR